MRALVPLLPLALVACADPPPSRDVYACQNGLIISVERMRDRAELTLSTGEMDTLERKRTFPGLRYTADKLIWFERGDEAVIERKGDTTYCRLAVRGVPVV